MNDSQILTGANKAGDERLMAAIAKEGPYSARIMTQARELASWCSVHDGDTLAIRSLHCEGELGIAYAAGLEAGRREADQLRVAAFQLTYGLDAWKAASGMHDVIHERHATVNGIAYTHTIRYSDLRALRAALAPFGAKP